MSARVASLVSLCVLVSGCSESHAPQSEWIAVEGVPSVWENATLFAFDGRMLPSMEAFTGEE